MTWVHLNWGGTHIKNFTVQLHTCTCTGVYHTSLCVHNYDLYCTIYSCMPFRCWRPNQWHGSGLEILVVELLFTVELPVRHPINIYYYTRLASQASPSYMYMFTNMYVTYLLIIMQLMSSLTFLVSFMLSV